MTTPRFDCRRRFFLRTACAAGLLLCGLQLHGAAPTDSKPNIVLILSDDHAWTDYGFMGHPIIQTPNLDKLAARALGFLRGTFPRLSVGLRWPRS